MCAVAPSFWCRRFLSAAWPISVRFCTNNPKETKMRTEQQPNQFKSTTIPLGGEGDVACLEQMYIYLIARVKVGSTSSIMERAKQLGYPPEDLRVLMIVPAGCMTLNGIQHMEDIEGWKHGFTPDHNGQRMSAIRARLGNNGIGVGRPYVLTSVDTGISFTVTHAARFERANKLCRKAIADAANPKQSRKHVTVNGVKHTVAYADQKKGGE
jgi:hypothetical protein